MTREEERRYTHLSADDHDHPELVPIKDQAGAVRPFFYESPEYRRKLRAAKQRRVSDAELERLLLPENRLESWCYGTAKEQVCLNCGWIGKNIGHHLYGCPVTREPLELYIERWGLALNLPIAEAAKCASALRLNARRRERNRKTVAAKRLAERQAEAARARAALAREPRNFQEWWPTQAEFASHHDFARVIGVSTRSVIDWCNATKTPTGERRRKLYAITRLAAYAPMNGAAPMLVPILEDLRNFVASTVRSRNGRYFLNHYFARCFGVLAESGVSNPVAAVSPDVLVQFAPRVPRTRWALGFVGRFLARTGRWTAERHAKFDAELRRIFPTPSRIENAPKYKPVPLLAQLVERLGFSTRELRNMRTPEETENGLRLSDGRLIAFGDELHQVSRDAWLSWTSRERPTVFLFFQRLPIERDRQVGRVWLTQTLRASGVAANRSVSSAMRHFEADFRANPNLRWLRLHFEGFHRMDHQRARRSLDRLYEKFGVHLPAPYFSAVLAASNLLPGAQITPRRGKTCLAVWGNIDGFRIEVRWPTVFFRGLSDGRIQPRIARELLRLAASWTKRMKITRAPRAVPRSTADAFGKLDRSLAHALGLIRVKVSELTSGRIWEANLLEPGRVWERNYLRRRGKDFDLPLLELLQGGPLNQRCEVCRHSERGKIDEEIRAQQPQPKFSEIAKRYVVGYPHLLWHAGRLTVRRAGIGARIEKRSHVGVGVAGRAVMMPAKFLGSVARDNGTNLASAIRKLQVPS